MRLEPVTPISVFRHRGWLQRPMQTRKHIKQIKNSLRFRFPRVSAMLRRIRLRHVRHHLEGCSPEEVFTRIYRNGGWHADSVSGIGSTPDETRGIRDRLPDILRQFDIRTMLDIPCGDFGWMSRVQLELEQYVGADIVKPLVERNNRKYGQDGNYPRSFQHLDITRDPLPPADLVLCRDCLIHLSLEDGQRALGNVKASSAKYLFTTTYTGRRWNDSIATGQFYPINLQAPPFHLPPPQLIVNEQCAIEHGGYQDRCLALWNVNDIPNYSHHPHGQAGHSVHPRESDVAT